MDCTWIVDRSCVDYAWIVQDVAWVRHALGMDCAWIVHGLNSVQKHTILLLAPKVHWPPLKEGPKNRRGSVLMEINEDSFEPKSSMERPWNPEIQG